MSLGSNITTAIEDLITAMISRSVIQGQTDTHRALKRYNEASLSPLADELREIEDALWSRPVDTTKEEL